MAKITKVQVGEALVGDGNEVAHIDLIIGPRGSPAETAFCNGLVNNKHGFTSLLAVIAPNLPCKPNTLMFNKVTINDARQAVQMFGPAQHGVAKAVQDAVAEGIIPADEADDLYVLVGVFIHWEAADDAKIQKYNYEATKLSIQRAVKLDKSPAFILTQFGFTKDNINETIKATDAKTWAPRPTARSSTPSGRAPRASCGSGSARGSTGRATPSRTRTPSRCDPAAP